MVFNVIHKTLKSDSLDLSSETVQFGSSPLPQFSCAGFMTAALCLEFIVSKLPFQNLKFQG